MNNTLYFFHNLRCNMLIKYILYENETLNDGALVVYKNRLYSPGREGIRWRAINQELLSAIVVAYHNNKPVGCITLDRNPLKKKKEYYQVVNTWIKPKYRRRGIAKNLLSVIDERATFTVAGYATPDGRAFYNTMSIKCMEF